MKNIFKKPSTGFAKPGTTLIVLIIAALIIVGGVIYGTTHKSNSTKGKSTSNQPKGPKGSAAHDLTPYGTSAKASTSLTLKEYGLVVPLADSLQGLTYNTITGPDNSTVYNLRLDKYTSLANACMATPAATLQSFATIVKGKGTYSDTDKSHGQTLLKQFDGFFVAQLGSGSVSTQSCKDTSVVGQLTDLTNTLNSALLQSFGNAQLTK